MKATFVDFEDSFSYNIIQELVSLNMEVEVVSWKDYEMNPSEGLLVLGPGPGHPDDYQRIFPLVREWLSERRPFFGICLGHQILWKLQGEEIVRSKEPKHGQKMKLDLTPYWRKRLEINGEVFVQRYNSLAVLAQPGMNPEFTNFIQDDEITITSNDHVLTYQFHPESIGTSYRKEFMRFVYSIIPK